MDIQSSDDSLNGITYRVDLILLTAGAALVLFAIVIVTCLAYMGLFHKGHP